MVINFNDPKKIQDDLSKYNISAELQLNIKGASVEQKGPSTFLIKKLDQSNVTMKQEQIGSFVWKTIRHRNELDYSEMILGTYEENTANEYMIYSFFVRMVFNDKLKLMAKVTNITNYKT